MHGCYYVYILTNKYHNVLYTGFTNDVYRRVTEHKEGVNEGFTKRYNVKKLVYFEEHPDATSALHREYLVKRWKRQWKIDLINGLNPEWRDLFEDFLE